MACAKNVSTAVLPKILFGDWTHASNWLSMCTPHGGAGDVYLGKGGISTDSFDGQSGSIVRSIKMTEGTIGFYKGIYAFLRSLLSPA